MEYKLKEILNKSVNYLVEKNSSQGNWEDVRSTAVVLHSFNQVLVDRNVNESSIQLLIDIIENSKSWLAGQARREERGLSWNSEIWDTSVCVIALSKDEKYRDKVNLAINWLISQKCPINHSWYDEIWESILALISIIHYEKSLGINQLNNHKWIDSTLNWLCEFPIAKEGKFISSHYSAFFIWLCAELKDANYLPTDAFLVFEKMAKVIFNWMIEFNRNNVTWSSYIFSNSYCLFSVCYFTRVYKLSLELDFENIINWYNKVQSNSGCFEDYEDSALSILALSSIIEKLESEHTLKINVDSKLDNNHSLNCFIGYCGKSHSIALIVKDHISHFLPQIKLYDWNWDFITGNILYSEIERISKLSDISIFLITKDDVIINDKDFNTSAPRDNVVFEVGYFSAKLGFNKTILIVESGTKLPSDWGGILYFSYKNKETIPSIILSISRHLKNIGLYGDS
jgi:hypothetical protein